MANNYEVNYDDQRFSQVEAQRDTALSDLENTYASMIDKSDQYYQAQIDASKEWADRQAQLQQEQTDFAIQKVEQQKEQAKKDYTKEQSGAYVDWQKQSNQHGANAEQMAAQGLAGSGYSESSQVSMYNTYQNRVTAARESYQQAILNYNNSITEARLQNNSLLAEIAYNALQQQLELSLQGFQYKNQLILDKTAKKLEVDQMYHNRYQDVLAQINHENSMAEQIRQYNESKALEEKKLAEQTRQFNAQLAEEQRQFNASMAARSSGGSGGSSGSKSGSKQSKVVRETKPIDDNSRRVNGGDEPNNTKKTNKSSGFTGGTYGAAVDYMRKNGVSNDVASAVMTKEEWTRRKVSGSKNAHTANYNNYAEYLRDYCEYAIG